MPYRTRAARRWRHRAAPQAGQVADDGAIGVEAVRAAIERQRGIVETHIRIEPGEIAGRDIGRIGDDQIETAGAERFTPSTAHDHGAIAQIAAPQILHGGAAGVRRQIDGDAVRLRPFAEQRAENGPRA